MNKTIHIGPADLITAPEVRQLLPNPDRDVELHVVVRRRPDLEAADEEDTFILDAIRYRMRWKNITGSEADNAMEFGLLHLGRIAVGNQ